MLITISLLILAYLVMGKDISGLLEKVKNIDWRGKINALRDRLRPGALKAGRVAPRPLLQFYYVMDDDKTSTLDRVLIYAAIIYTILPMDLIPCTVYKFLGILDDGVAMLYVYKRIKDKITPEINAKVEDTLNDWFGVEYELIETENAWHISGLTYGKTRKPLVIPRVMCDIELGIVPITQLLTKGKTELIKDFTSHKSGKKFDAYLVFNASTGRVSYEFPPRK